jgi:hypothetical protein
MFIGSAQRPFDDLPILQAVSHSLLNYKVTVRIIDSWRKTTRKMVHQLPTCKWYCPPWEKFTSFWKEESMHVISTVYNGTVLVIWASLAEDSAPMTRLCTN